MERSKNDLFRLTTALTPRQITHVGYKKILSSLTVPKDNDYSIEYYDHDITRSNEDQFHNDDNFANLQLTEKFFIQIPYLFTLNSLDKTHNHMISEAFHDIQAYESL